ncbi:MAG: PrgI family protein [Patescibacteria group bacterium]|nr:PrgI family protein [Patescibacteria group bacterium]
MQYMIPQDISIEDKIVFGLTFKQVAYILGGLGVAYIAYLSFAAPMNAGIAIFANIISLSFAFVRIQDLTLFQFIGVTLLYFFRPEKRYWQMNADTVYYVPQKQRDQGLLDRLAQKQQEEKQQETLRHLSDISFSLDHFDENITKATPEDPHPTVSDVDLLRTSF